MRHPKKIPSFTLTEMLLVLAISVIIAGMAFTIVTLFGRNIQLIGDNYSMGTEMNLFKDQIMVDFNRYNIISFEDKSRELKMSTALDSITYLWEEDYVLRNMDTLLKAQSSVKFYLMGDEVVNGHIDALKVGFGTEEEENFIFIYHMSDAYSFMMENGN